MVCSTSYRYRVVKKTQAKTEIDSYKVMPESQCVTEIGKIAYILCQLFKMVVLGLISHSPETNKGLKPV